MVEPAEPFTLWCRIRCVRRERGLAATLTTLYLQFEKRPRQHSGCRRASILCLAADRPPYGPVRARPHRIPLTDVVFEDRWGQPFSD